MPTVLDCYRTEVLIEGHALKIQLWDSAGQDDYSRLRPLGYMGADVFLLCYSVSDRESSKSVESKWLYELRNNAASVPCVLVATKLDLKNELNPSKIVSTQEGEAILKKHQLFSFVECSAK